MKIQRDNEIIELTPEEEAEYRAKIEALDISDSEAMEILMGGGEE